ncbi:class IV adenylate cyclase [candidate division KSB1 bacterium]|nr:class IV adenylate cyclase [candidate division KSB1 bacterium]
MKNLELKAKYGDPEQAHSKAVQLTNVKKEMYQTDIYFRVPQGKLKLRLCENCPDQLIAYERPAQYDSKMSDYTIFSTTSDGLSKVLAKCLPIEITIRKQRVVYLWKNVRIHLDDVAGLGFFIEFEAVLSENEKNGPVQSEKRIQFLKKHFEISQRDLIDCGYYELLKEER